MNSDVTVFFLEVLPRLKSGVLVHIHDIALPYDYPRAWRDWYYNEQYLLATALLMPQANFEVVLPNAFIAADPDLLAETAPLFNKLAGARRDGMSFWLRVR
jgi:hypothetical protein